MPTFRVAGSVTIKIVEEIVASDEQTAIWKVSSDLSSRYNGSFSLVAEETSKGEDKLKYLPKVGTTIIFPCGERTISWKLESLPFLEEDKIAWKVHVRENECQRTTPVWVLDFVRNMEKAVYITPQKVLGI